MRLTHFGGTALPPASENVDIGFEGRNALIPLRDGAFDQDGQAQPGTIPPITRSFKIVANLDTTLDALKNLARGGRRILKGVLRDESTYRQTFAKLSSIHHPRDPGQVNLQRVECTWTVDYPYWLASADEPPYLDQGLTLDSGLNLDGNHTDLAITGLVTAGTITNTGGVAIPRGYILIAPNAGGTVNTPRIENAANGMMLQYNGVIASGERFEIDLLTRSVKKDGVDVYADFYVPREQGDWMTLELGANVITVTCAAVAGTAPMEWHWSRHYA